ncbi:PLP-dependent transferase [Glarea lozoyensis ATCC 20868]|uniref:PLP-dependent transferase n=1 Tax=Glarea lozoyensis (strain ATCC 20868 / MF5171) TaxID=1116229 RepID=S3DEX4_GLAL2|nr:PLP-dependent transferase [Glarea lozoyensis ATCC 20868]EPE30541.1 PLP-dependent transferase [Glarea lozoyensis ATCC 20868]
MAPAILDTIENAFEPSEFPKSEVASAVIHRSLKSAPLQVIRAEGTKVTFSNGQTINDTTCGAAVACLGYHNERVKKAMIAQIEKFSYCNSMFFGTEIGEQLAEALVEGTRGEMAKALVMCSGSEAMDAAMKMARQYFMETIPKQPRRTKFIARHGSYHGTTWGALSVGGHVARRELFEPMLLQNCAKVSACNEYRGRLEGQSQEEYVARLAKELDDKFRELGAEEVIAFVAEPVVGAALGAVPAVPGYFKAMREVCDKYGALLILDEVMSGMGRCGSLHAWEQEGIVPDIQTIAKGLGGGFAPIAAILINHRIADVLSQGSGAFSHGHTYQGHPVSCAAALEVQKIIAEDKLVDNVREVGAYFGELLHAYLDDHPHIGNVRGKGFFWGVEFVKDKITKTPFPKSLAVANTIFDVGMGPEYGISLYPGQGSVDGVVGDHVLIAPAYGTTREEIKVIAELTRDVIFKALSEFS